MEGAKKLSEIRSYPLKIKGDDFSLEGEFLYGMVTNSVSVGGFKGITGEDVDLTDGLFEVTLVEQPGDMVEYGGIIAALMNRDIHSDYVHSYRSRTLTVESDGPLAWTRDGEYGGSYISTSVTNIRQGLEILVPGDKE